MLDLHIYKFDMLLHHETVAPELSWIGYRDHSKEIQVFIRLTTSNSAQPENTPLKGFRDRDMTRMRLSLKETQLQTPHETAVFQRTLVVSPTRPTCERRGYESADMPVVVSQI